VAHVLMVIAPAVFRDEEYAHPKQVLESAGARVTTASTARGACLGKLGMVAHADIALHEVEPADYDAVVFVGGSGAEVFFDDPVAHRIAGTMADAGMVVAAICIAPSILARAGVLHGRRATAFSSQEPDLTARGAIWTGAPVEIDGAIVTANGPEAAADFGRALADLLGLT